MDLSWEEPRRVTLTIFFQKSRALNFTTSDFRLLKMPIVKETLRVWSTTNYGIEVFKVDMSQSINSNKPSKLYDNMAALLSVQNFTFLFSTLDHRLDDLGSQATKKKKKNHRGNHKDHPRRCCRVASRHAAEAISQIMPRAWPDRLAASLARSFTRKFLSYFGPRTINDPRNN